MTAGRMAGKRIYPFRYFGGKFSHLDFLLSLFPVDPRLYHFFKTLRDRPADLCRAVALSPHSRRDFEQMAEGQQAGLDDVERARRTFILFTQSINSLADNRAKIWSYSLGLYHVRTLSANAAALGEASERLNGMTLKNQSWEKLIDECDRPGAFPRASGL